MHADNISGNNSFGRKFWSKLQAWVYDIRKTVLRARWCQSSSAVLHANTMPENNSFGRKFQNKLQAVVYHPALKKVPEYGARSVVLQ